MNGGNAKQYVHFRSPQGFHKVKHTFNHTTQHTLKYVLRQRKLMLTHKPVCECLQLLSSQSLKTGNPKSSNYKWINEI